MTVKHTDANMSELEKMYSDLATNQCNCVHLLRDHTFDGKRQTMPCKKCKCADYDHTLGMVPGPESLKYVKVERKALSEPTPAPHNISEVKPDRTCPKCGKQKTPGCTRKLCHKCYNESKALKKAST